MAQGVINKYIWLIDTIMRHKRITRSDINRLWMENVALSGGNPMPRRTFYTYCRAVETTFDVTIECNLATYEYYIDSIDNSHERNLCDWLLDSVAISGTLSDSRNIASRIVLEDVPSARSHLALIMEALKGNRRIEFRYNAFDRSGSEMVTFDPYFVRIFKQRWYVIGNDKRKKDIRTYSLDRISELRLSVDTFTPTDLDATEYFADSFGIFRDKSEPQIIKLKVITAQAKYFRVLPLHHSQREEIHDKYSIFTYRMLATYDLVQEILSHGSKIEVLSPETLRIKIMTELAQALEQYK